jgi:hypothetical protein
VVAGAAARYGLGQDTGPSATDLAKQTQNPVADLTTVPLQFNFYSGGPLEDRTLYNLNFQPVFPLPVGSNLNLIARTIVPYFNVPGPRPTDRVTGIGDIQQQLFFTSKNPGAFVIGVGPLLSFPTATNDSVKTGDWAAGPAFVVVHTTGEFVLGALFTQLWTFASSGEGPHVNQMLVQPFVNYNLSEGWSLSFGPTVTANWSAPSGEKWTVPLGTGVAKVTSLGRQPIKLALSYYYNVARPSTTGKSQLQMTITFLFPHPPAPK